MNEYVIIEILDIKEMLMGGLSFGVMTIDPNNIDMNKFPSGSVEIYPSIANSPKVDDLLILWKTSSGSKDEPSTLNESFKVHVSYEHSNKTKFEVSGFQTQQFESNNVTEDNQVDMKISKECKICFDKPVESILIPCGHMCLCKTCALNLCIRERICPICRCMIKETYKVYKG
ncbi:hypothetical protein PGB90_000855 [Kerria lacca]